MGAGHEKGPAEAEPVRRIGMTDAWVSDLKVSDHEAVSRIVFGLARECHEFALSSGIPSHSVEDQLPLVFGVLNGNTGNLLDARVVPASGAADLAALRIDFSPEGYRFLAEAAKDRMAGAVHVD